MGHTPLTGEVGTGYPGETGLRHLRALFPPLLLDTETCLWPLWVLPKALQGPADGLCHSDPSLLPYSKGFRAAVNHSSP